jgi:hypothetical protein
MIRPWKFWYPDPEDVITVCMVSPLGLEMATDEDEDTDEVEGSPAILTSGDCVMAVLMGSGP